MRITIVCPAYPPMPGGVSDFTRKMALALAAEPDTAVTVVTSPGAQADRDVTVVARQARWGFTGFASLLGHLKASKPDVVVLQYVPHLYERHGFSWPITEFVALLRHLKVPVVTVAHELYYGRHEGWKVQPFGWVQRYGLLPLFWGSRRVVLTVPDRLRRMEAVFPRWRGKFAVMPVGANLAPAAGVDRAGWRAALGLSADTFVLLHLGLAHPSKRTDDLAATLDALEAAKIPARLVMAGGGSLAHPHAIDAGFLSEEAAAAALAAADLAVLPLSEGASARRTSLMNALAAGLPVVSTFGVNTDRALFPPEALRLVPADDAGAFADAVVALARDPEARERLGEAGRALYAEHFSWAVLGPRWRQLLAEAAE